MVLLVGINAKYIHTTLAVRSLQANAGKYRKDVEIAEYTINHRREEIFQDIYRRKPEAVGFSCYLWNIEYVMGLAGDLKKVLPNLFLFFGGPEVSYHPEEVLAKYEYADLVMVGEGERTFQEFMAYFVDGDREISSIDGIVYRGIGGLHRTKPRQGLDMDDLVYPYDDMETLKNRIIYYESMRGCPFSCSYCLSSIEKSVRIKSPEKTERELDFFLENKVPQVKFVDRTFNCNHAYAYRIWKYIGEHDNGVTNFHFEIGGDLLHEEDFLLFDTFRPGLVQFEIGVQSTNPDTLKAIRRTADWDLLQKNVARIHARGNIHQHLDLIAGLPYEDFNTFKKSFCDVYAMKPDQFQLGFLKVLDGSFMNEKRNDYEIQASSLPPYEIFSTKWLSYEDVLSLKGVEEMVEVYYNSFQFAASMIYLERLFKDAYCLYEELAKEYEEKHLFERKINRRERYEVLYAFGKKHVPETDAGNWQEIITYDWYRRDFAKEKPTFVKPDSETQKREIRAFFDRECETHRYLPGYEGYVTRQLYHMVYLGEYTVDIQGLLKDGALQKREPYYILFDYKNRNPLNYAAAERILTMDEFTGKP